MKMTIMTVKPSYQELEQKIIELERAGIDKGKILEALQDSKERFKKLSNLTFEGILLHYNGIVVDTNDSLLRMLGYTREEMIDQNIIELCVPQAYHAKIRMNMAQKKTNPYEAMAKKKDGCLFPIEIESMDTENGKIRVSAIRDITERRQARTMIEDGVRKCCSIMDSMRDCAYICSSDFRIEYMNPPMIVRVGRDCAGEICHKAIYDRDEKCSWCVFDKVQQNEHIKYEFLDPKDNRYFSVTDSPIVNADGGISKLTIFRDISDIKTMEKNRLKTEIKLQQAHKMEAIGTLAGGIAHDFNNILSAILGYTELTLEDTKIGSRGENYLKEVLAATERARGLVKQILTFARQKNETLQPIQVTPIAKEVVKFLRSSIPTTIEIRSKIQSDSLILSNSTQIHQMLMNLCTNAAHAMEEEGGVLSINIRNIQVRQAGERSGVDLIPGDYLQISVSDTGTGISPEIIDTIFEPYFTTKEVGKGTGMGLALVQGIVESSGGKIMVESKIGKGTLFSLYLPSTENQTANKVDKTEKLPTGSERILFVDDEAAIVKTGSQILEKLGYKVSSLTSSVEALALFKQTPNDFDLVITDMTMPHMAGDKLVMELQRIRPDIPIMVCTGYTNRMTEEAAVSLGINAFVYKPITKVDLARNVRKVMDETKCSAPLLRR